MKRDIVLDHVGVPGAAVKDKELDAEGLRALAVERLESSA
jgi:hypothetical protein